jgi:predicted dehydrogenase
MNRRTTSIRKIRYAVVGLGHIAQVAVLPAFRNARNSELVSIVSGEPEKREKLARKYRLEHVYSYDDYDHALSQVDAVYLALPNQLHRDYTIRAAQARVHVLCEKPMAVAEDDCQAMIDAADHNGVKLMIAYRLHFEAGNLEAICLAENGKLGKLRIFTSEFAQQVAEDNIRVSQSVARGGGPLYDMGVYCINAARYLFRAEPTEVFAVTANNGEKRFRNVEEMTSVVMRFHALSRRTHCHFHMQFRRYRYKSLHTDWYKGLANGRSGLRIRNGNQASAHDWRKNKNKNLSQTGPVCC